MNELNTSGRTAAQVSMLPVYILSLATFVIMFQGFMVAPLLPTLSEQFGTTVRHVSFIEPAYLLGYGLFTLVYAPLSDRIGRFRIVAFLPGNVFDVYAVDSFCTRHQPDDFPKIIDRHRCCRYRPYNH
ncbi:MAG: MFS transporter [Sphingobacterium sp.]